MPSPKHPLTDFQVHDRLVAASDALGSEPGETGRGNTALEAARRALVILQIGLVGAMEKNSDEVEGIIKDE
jgi:hypothetical protein